jgi:hypothetical protein
MEAGERKRILASLQAAGAALHPARRLLIVSPVGRILRGFCIEDSSDARRVYLWAFVQPLFVPSSTVVLSLGRRLGGGSRTWSSAEIEAAAPAMRAEGEAFFGAIASPQALARWELLGDQPGDYAQEVRAFALVAAGQYVEGARALRGFARALPAGGPAWLCEMGARAEALAGAAEIDGDAAQARLRAWEASTRAAIGVAVP